MRVCSVKHRISPGAARVKLVTLAVMAALSAPALAVNNQLTAYTSASDLNTAVVTGGAASDGLFLGSAGAYASDSITKKYGVLGTRQDDGTWTAAVSNLNLGTAEAGFTKGLTFNTNRSAGTNINSFSDQRTAAGGTATFNTTVANDVLSMSDKGGDVTLADSVLYMNTADRALLLAGTLQGEDATAGYAADRYVLQNVSLTQMNATGVGVDIQSTGKTQVDGAQAVADAVLNNTQINTAGGAALNIGATATGNLITGERLVTGGGNAITSSAVAGKTNTVELTASQLGGGVVNNGAGTLSVGLSNSVLKGDAESAMADGTLNLALTGGSVMNGNLTGTAGTLNVDVAGGALAGGASVTGGAVNVSMTGGQSVWNVATDSAVTALNLRDGAVVDVSRGNLTTTSLGADASASGAVRIDGQRLEKQTGGAPGVAALTVSGTAQGHYQVALGGSLKQLDTSATLIDVQDKTSKATFSSNRTDGGLYQYELVQHGTGWGLQKTTQVSDAGATLQAMQAVPAEIAVQQSRAVNDRLNALRSSDLDGVSTWATLLGGRVSRTTDSGAEYDLNTGGVVAGGDYTLKQADNTWVFGGALSASMSDMDIRHSEGDSNSFGAMAYMAWRNGSGLFADGMLQYGRYDNSLTARVNGSRAQSWDADYNQNGYGVGARVGYTWHDASGLFVEPYFGLSAHFMDKANYALGGQQVRADSYSLVMAELGSRVGYDLPLASGSLRPYMDLAAVQTSADGSVSMGGESVSAGYDQAGFRVGLGAELALNNKFGSYAGVQYARGQDYENPLQGVVGVTWYW